MLHVRAGDIEYKGIYRGKLFIQLLRNEETPSDRSLSVCRKRGEKCQTGKERG